MGNKFAGKPKIPGGVVIRAGEGVIRAVERATRVG